MWQVCMVENEQQNIRPSPPTGSDVARRAGVSQAAVSYVFNGRHNRHVSAETREKIVQAAQELGYRAHPTARSLRKGQSDEICCIINAPPSFFSYRLYLSLQQQIVLRGMFARRPAGLVMSQLVDMADDVALARQMGIEHIVLISIRPLEDVAAVIFPGWPVGHIAACHLLERGRRHLGIVRPRDPLLEEIFQQRLEGMRSALAGRADTMLDMLPLSPTLPEARALVQSALVHTDHPTGIYAFNDEFAFYLLKALTERDIGIPRDIALVGTDDLSTCELMRPSLTSIRFDDVDAIGRRAVGMLVGMRGGQPAKEPLSYEIVPRLIQRESS